MHRSGDNGASGTAPATCEALRAFLNRDPEPSGAAGLRDRLARALAEDHPAPLVGLYGRALPLIEADIWAPAPDPARVELYQQACRELEALLARGGDDPRHAFVVVIPVADRPRHLRSCLDSLLELCRRFGYGGLRDGRFAKVSVVIADDSRDEESTREIAAICREFTGLGLDTDYLGRTRQLELLDALGDQARERLPRVLGRTDRAAFYHKGPSLTRNIAYLLLRRIADRDPKTLFHFVDSDQEFRIRVDTPDGERDLYALNYFRELDRIFTETDAEILTGKVVGDPPVSPAVMAGNLLEDLTAFLERLATLPPEAPCAFHAAAAPQPDRAAYHDMAGLFGFAPPAEAFGYRCTLAGTHSNAGCLDDFARRLGPFFHGEHPTRSTCYLHGSGAPPAPARTVYTGNYVLRPAALRYFIPFATLRLRMAGPTLGRIVRAQRGAAFVSANLPLLHRRTVTDSGRSEFRPGVSGEHESIDLCGEYERQFYGDLMLFTVEKLAATGYPGRVPAPETIAETLRATEAEIHRLYLAKRREILERLAALKALAGDAGRWWNARADAKPAVAQLDAFLANMERNFGADSRCYPLIDPGPHRDRRRREIAAAILAYPADLRAWEETLATGTGPAASGETR